MASTTWSTWARRTASSSTDSASKGGRSPKVTSTGSATTKWDSRTTDACRVTSLATTDRSRSSAWRAVGVAALVVIWPAADLLGSDLPPWRDLEDLPLPDGLLSSVVERAEQSIMTEPTTIAARRGTALLGARLPVFGA